MKTMNRLCGKVVVLTGAASGIGAETAKWLTREDASVVLADINEIGLERKLRELRNLGARVVCIVTDVTRRGSWQNLFDSSIREFGHIDVLVNCAGIIQPGPVENLSEEWVQKRVNVNLIGTVYGTQVFLPYFRLCKRGHLIHMASLGGIAPLPNEAVYSATKFAVRGFCLAVALELHDSPVHMSVICPDSVQTPQVEQEATQGGSALSFTSHLLQPSDVARAVVTTILNPRREVLVTPLRGLLSKVGGFSPNLMGLFYPLLKGMGERGRAKFLRTLPIGQPVNER